MAAPQPDTTIQIVSAAIITVASAAGAAFARSAHRKSQQIHREITVPPSETGTTKEPGYALKAIEDDLIEHREDLRDLTVKVDGVIVSQARHEGHHEGLLRDIERIMRRVYKENGH